MGNKLKLLWSFLFLVGLLSLVQPGIVAAHANVVRSNPPANSTLPSGQPPLQIQVWYSEDIEIKFSKLEVLDKNGKLVDKGDTRLMAGNAMSMLVSLNAALPDGVYTVLSSSASATDGHVVKSSFAFVVGVGALPTNTTMGSPIDEALKTGNTQTTADAMLWSAPLRWLNYMASTALVGGLFFYLVIWRASTRKLLKKGRIGAEFDLADKHITRRTRLLINYSFIALLIGWFLWLIYQTSNYSGQLLGVGGSRGIAAYSDFLFDSRYGVIWLGRLVLLGVAMAIWGGLARVKLNTLDLRWWWVVVGFGLAILLTTSLNSHAASIANYTFLTVFNDWLHLLATSFWVGGLFFIALTLPGALQVLVPGSGDKTRLLAALAPTFSQMAILSVAVLAVSGSVSAFTQLGNVADLFATPYGIILSIKLGLFVVLLLLGFYNQQIIIPKIRQFMRVSAANSEKGPGSLAAGKVGQQFRRSLALEAILGVVVLLVVGVLTTQAPTVAAQGASSGVRYLQKEVGDLKIALAVSPAQLGDNTFEVALSDSANQVVGNAAEVRLTFGMSGMQMGDDALIDLKPTNPTKGRYLGQTNLVSMVGDWTITVTVKRSGKDDVVTSFNFKLQ